MSIATTLTHWCMGGGIQDRAGKPKQELLRHAESELDRDVRIAQVRVKELSSSEFDLLHFLLTHSKNLVTPHTVLSTAATGINPIRPVSSMKTLLSLRKKLETIFEGKQYLRIEPWVLYRFDSMGRQP
jgi:DNA-binding response OmpR family regulator